MRNVEKKNGPTVPTFRFAPVIAQSLVAIILALWGSAAHSQGCPSPWSSASSVLGTYSIQGEGSAASPPYTQNVDQSATVMAVMPAQFGACVWSAALPGGIGKIADAVSVHDFFTEDVCAPDPKQLYNWDGAGTSVSNQLTVAITSAFNTYGFGGGGDINGTYAANGCLAQGVQNLQISWGPLSGINLQSLPMPDTAELSGVKTFADAPITVGSTLQANWNLAWSFSPIPDDVCEDCMKSLVGQSASDISARGQSLGEDMGLVGTPFYLHYESARAMGRAGVDVVAMSDAHSLGGWTLSVHHVFELLLQSYCPGGSCTPYATVPKSLFLGSGEVRSDDRIQAATPLNGNLYVAALDGSEVYVFDMHGLHRQTLHPLTGAVKYTFGYDPFNRLISVTDDSKNVTTIQRDVNGHPTAIVGPYGQTTTLTVDANGFLSQIADPAGHSTMLTNSVSGLLTKLIDPKGKVYTFQYDGYGRLTQHADPAGGSINLSRTSTASGFTVTETTALGRSASFQVGFSSTASQTNRQFTSTWQSGLQSTETSSFGAAQITEGATMPDGTSYSTVQTPDPRWGMQAPVISNESFTFGTLTMNTTRSRSASLSNSANPFSLTSQTELTTINGRTYRSVFTASNKTYTDTSPVGRVVTTTLDVKERPISVQYTGLAATQISYSSRGRISAITESNRKTSMGYDSDGRLNSIVNPLGLKTAFTHDLDGHLLSTTFPDGRVLHFAYDANGNLTSVTPPGGSAHKFTYSTINATTVYSPPALSGVGETKFSYNVDHDLTGITRPDGQRVAFGYDAAGRVKSLTTPSAVAQYAYDTVTGNLRSANITGGEKLSYGYNGPLLASWTLAGTVHGSVARSYDDNFQMVSETVDSAQPVNFSYDDDQLLVQAGLLQLAYSPDNALLMGVSLGAATDIRSYDAFGDLANYSAKYGSTVLYSVALSRDDNGRVVGAAENIGGSPSTWAYSYDDAGRLAEISLNGTTIASYGYDGNSNRLSSGSASATYDAQDRMLTYGSATYTYTANGEMARYATGGQSTSYAYDELGNLTGATLPNGTAITYILDAERNRVGKQVNGALVAGFLYDGADVVAQLDGTNKIVSQFVYGVASDAPDYMIKGGITYRIFSDPLGSPRLVVNSATGQIVERIDYDAFGNITGDTNPGFQPFGFAGGLYDADTGLVHFGARDYDPRTARWIAKDPILFAGADVNLYGYALNDPLNLVDPSGLAPCKKCKDKTAPKTKPPLPPTDGHENASKIGNAVAGEVAGRVAKKSIENAGKVSGPAGTLPGPKNLEPPKSVKELERLRKMDEDLKCTAVKPTAETEKDLWDRAIDALSGDTGDKPPPNKPAPTPDQQDLQQKAQQGANDPSKNAY